MEAVPKIHVSSLLLSLALGLEVIIVTGTIPLNVRSEEDSMRVPLGLIYR